MKGKRTSGGRRLNAKTFAIKQGDKIYVTVPVLIYKPGKPSESEGYEYMRKLFETQATPRTQAMEMSGDWCSLSPHNSEPDASSGGDDD